MSATATQPASSPSIRRRLLIFLLPPLTALLLIGAFVDYRAALLFAHQTNDQRLTDTALAIAGRIAAAGGAVPANVLPRRLPTTGVERGPDFLYSIRDSSGQLLAGEPQLRNASRTTSNPSFADANLFGTPVRIASYALRTATGPLTVNVATADASHTGPAHFVLGSTWLMGFIQLDVTLLLVWIGVHFGLKPLLSVRREIETRSARELRPLELASVPAEVRPLVEGLNLLFEMLGEAARGQRQFVADTAHQLRTPLAGLIGHLEVMMQEPAAAPLKERLKTLHDGMTHLAHSANQLLALARTDPAASLADRFESVDLKALGERILERNLDRSVESCHDLGADIQPAQVTGSVRLLEDLLGNLVDNALHYTPAGGHVTVRCGSHHGRTYLEVEDDGPGIPAAERARVRERFYRMPGSTGHGCGLGLAIVDEISRLHGADLTIDAGTNGRGTKVRVTFGHPQTENHVAIRRSLMSETPSRRTPSASSKVDPLESACMDPSPSTRGNNTPMSLSTDSNRTAGPTARPVTTLRGAAGFNLVELMIVITLVAILMGIGIPSYKYVTNSNRVSGEVNNLLGDMTAARAEAIKEGLTVTVCPSSDGKTCSGGTNWAIGWIAFTDFNSNGTPDYGAPNNDTVIRYQPGFGSTDTFQATNLPQAWLSFNRDGIASDLLFSTDTNALFTLETSPVNSKWRRCLEIRRTGQMTTEHFGQGECPSS